MSVEIEEIVNALNSQVAALINQGAFNEAYPVAVQAFQLGLKELGERHSSTATAINNLAYLFFYFGDLQRAEEFYLLAIRIAETTIGKAHPDYAARLTSLAELYRTLGRWTEAESLLQEALSISLLWEERDESLSASILNNLGLVKKEQGALQEAIDIFIQARDVLQNRPQAKAILARVINNLADTYRMLGDLASAEPLFLKSLEMRKNLHGENSSAFATVLQNLGMLYLQQGRFAESRQYMEKALSIRRNVQGEEHPEYAMNLMALAKLTYSLGDYRNTIAITERTLAIQKKLYGELHPDVAETLDDLAQAEWALGEYQQADDNYSEAGRIFEAVLGVDHPSLMRHFSAVGQFLANTGRLKSAEWNYQRAMELAKASGALLDYAGSAYGLASVHLARYDYEQALSLFRIALEIQTAALGPNHPDVAQTMDVYFSTIGHLDPEKALPLLEHALEVRRLNYGENHPETSVSRNNLGVFYLLHGNFLMAESHLLDALLAQSHGTNGDSLGQAHTLTTLAVVMAGQERISDASNYLNQMAELHDRLIDKIFTLGSDQRRMEYLDQVQKDFKIHIALIHRFLSKDTAAVAALFDVVLRRKGIGAEALSIQKSTVISGRYPHLSASLAELTSLEAQIAHLTLDPPKNVNTDNTLTALNEKREHLEAQLARQIPEMRLATQLQNSNTEALAGALPKASALVEFLRFEELDILPTETGRRIRFLTPRYLAFVLLAGHPATIKMVDLGPATEIEMKLAAWRNVITGESTLPQAGRPDDESFPPMDIRQGLLEISRQVGSRTISNISRNGMEDGAVLRQAVFDPLLPALAGSTRVFLAPDGSLSHLPFEALPLDDHGCLIDEYEISYLSVGRDLLRFGQKHPSQPGPALVISAPDYDLGSERWPEVQAGIPFRPLEGARQEGESSAAALQASFWVGTEAVEGALKRVRSPQVLHISTHGFFLEEVAALPEKENFLRSSVSPSLGRFAHLQGVQNPLLRSGLALAGANVWIQQASPPREAEDGLLNAVDVSGLDLLDTDLVVLSACDTGLGWVQSGEGVFGLRRAFTIAGAHTLVMSLWKVPDDATRQLMDLFYTYLIAHKLGTAESLRQAQLSLKRKYESPFYWGAFICQGDPAPLRMNVQTNDYTHR